MICRLTNTKLLAATAVAALLGAAGSTLAQPANDNCANATVVAVGATAFSSFDATTDGAASCGFNGDPGSNDVWFTFTPPNSGDYVIGTCGSFFDTIMNVLDSCGGFELACNDDACGFLESQVTVNLTAGVPVLVRVSGYQGDTGDGTLTITDATVGPGNDNCGGALAVGAGVHPVDTNAATTDGAAGCGFNGQLGDNDIWFSYTPGVTGNAVIDTCACTFDTILNAFDSCGGFEIACNDDACGLRSRITVSVTQGVPILIRVAGWTGARGTGSLTIIDPIEGGVPGDNCAEAIAVGDGDFAYSNVGATTDGFSSCGFQTGPDVWFDYLASASSAVTFTTCDPSRTHDTVMNIFDSCGGFELGCNDDGPPACGIAGIFSGSTITLSVVEGAHYIVRVSGYNGSQGGGVLHIAAAPPPPANDLCADATVVTAGSYAYTTLQALNDGTGTCAASAASPDVWFSYTPPATGVSLINTCGSAYDTALAAFDTCGGTQLACNDDFCGLQSQISVVVTEGVPVLIRVSGFAGATGNGTLTVNDPEPPPVGCLTAPVGAILEDEVCGQDINGGCNDPGFAVQSIPSSAVIFGTAWANGGTRDTDWYEITLSERSRITASLQTEFVGRVFIFPGTCPATSLATSQTPLCGDAVAVTADVPAGTARIFAGHDVFDGTPCALDGRTHYILTVTADPIRACCTSGGCILATAAECNAAGGTLQGPGTDCGSMSYDMLLGGGSDFEDISTTGTIVTTTGDDALFVVNLAFPFSHYGTSYTTINVCTNGNAQFPPSNSGAFTNVGIPAVGVPNNLLAVLWDDFNLNINSNDSITQEVRGTSGVDLRHIIQWTNVAQFGMPADTDFNTFQIVLFEDGHIEYRYSATLSDCSFEAIAGGPGATIGVEDQTGSEFSVQYAFGDAPVNPGDNISLTPTASGGACDGGTPCRADFNNDTFVNPDDLADFITCFFLDIQFPGFCPAADFNGDTSRDPDDLADFITTFFLAVQFGC